MPHRKIENADRRLIIHRPEEDLRSRNSRDYDFCIPDPKKFLESQKIEAEILNVLLSISHAARIVTLVNNPEEQEMIQTLGDSLELPVDFQARVTDLPIEKSSEIKVTCMDRRLNLKDHFELSSPKAIRVAGGNFLFHPKIAATLGDSKLVKYISEEIPRGIAEEGLKVNGFSNHTTIENPYDCGAVGMALSNGFKIKGPEHYANLLLESAEYFKKEHGNVVPGSPVELYVLDTRENILGTLNLNLRKHVQLFVNQDSEEMHHFFDFQKI